MENLSVTDARLRLLEDNLKKVRDEIAETALKSGRDPREVKLMAVTKTVSVELINHANTNQAVLTLKSLEAFAKAADGQATKIIIPSEIQGIAGLATSLKELVTDENKE